ncbi:MAG: oligosaccharide flippase family protein [Comamonas sp.]|uniref:oligosaccharide flippase family protein n=1 Tax=Comamonas sp. TaxID=34028 RepID=UPI002826F9F1|nr:oligosaccharide flippase family protein [Comamonas sp.]MDR0214450.1 oligosaccharide flippase family protein [Comamonas sp.]
MKNWRSIFYLIGVQGANYLAPIAIMYILTKNSSIETYGKFAFWYAVLVYFQTIIDYGFNYTATREVSSISRKDDFENLSEIFYYILFSKILISAFVFSTIIISYFFLNFDLKLVVIVFLGAMLSSLVPNWFFQGIQRIGNISLFNILGKMSFVFITFLFVSDYSLINIFIAYLISASIPLIYSSFLFKKLNFIKTGYLKNGLFFIKNGRNIFLANVLAVLLSNGGVISLGFFADDKVLGVYSFCERIVKSFLGLFSPLFTAFYPVFSRKFSFEFKGGVDFHKKFTIILLTVAFLFLLAAYFISGFFLAKNTNYNSSYFSILMVWVLVSLMNNAFGIQFLCASGNDRLYVRGMLSSFFVFLSFVGFNFFDDWGVQVAMTTLVSELCLFVFNVRYYFLIKINSG